MVRLSEELQRLVDAKLQSGQFASREEVLAAAVAVWKEQEDLSPGDMELLKAEIERGLKESREGKSVPLDMTAIRSEIKRRREALKAK